MLEFDKSRLHFWNSHYVLSFPLVCFVVLDISTAKMFVGPKSNKNLAFSK